MGKDTVAMKIGNVHNSSIVALGNMVKETLQDMYAIDRQFIETWKRSAHNPPGFDCSMRTMLQSVGQTYRNIKSSTWIDRLMESVAKDNDNVIVTDVRYQNEMERLRNAGFTSVLVFRSAYFKPDAKHESEQYIIPALTWLSENTTNNLTAISTMDTTTAPSSVSYFDYFLRNEGTDMALEETCAKLSVCIYKS